MRRVETGGATMNAVGALYRSATHVNRKNRKKCREELGYFENNLLLRYSY